MSIKQSSISATPIRSAAPNAVEAQQHSSATKDDERKRGRKFCRSSNKMEYLPRQILGAPARRTSNTGSITPSSKRTTRFTTHGPRQRCARRHCSFAQRGNGRRRGIEDRLACCLMRVQSLLEVRGVSENQKDQHPCQQQPTGSTHCPLAAPRVRCGERGEQRGPCHGRGVYLIREESDGATAAGRNGRPSFRRLRPVFFCSQPACSTRAYTRPPVKTLHY
ncbi:hypothetical protein HDK77DRAFT_202225 [Phyllosticta capitalensis]